VTITDYIIENGFHLRLAERMDKGIIMSDASAFHSLAHLPRGGSGVVSNITGEPLLRRRLLEMGLTRGTRCELLRRAPLGDPIELRVRGYLLSLRAEQALCVRLEPTA
jgi:ferrous iron transport protein A